jgi:hypothetical protein
MPTSVSQLMESAGLIPAGVVRWNSPLPLNEPGVYVVTMTESVDAVETAPVCPVSVEKVQSLLDVRPELALKSRRPTRDELVSAISSMWLADESILYIGLAGTSVSGRVRAYYRTRIGARKPHAGGWPLKLLTNLEQLWVHYAPCESVADAETTMLRFFMANVSDGARSSVCDPELALPFANLQLTSGVRKAHGITGAREPREATPASSDVAPPPDRSESDPQTPSGVSFSQPVTAADLTAGRIRIPAATKPVLPLTKQRVDIALRGHTMNVRWNPRNEPGQSRSGVLGVDQERLRALVEQHERLIVIARDDGSFELT